MDSNHIIDRFCSLRRLLICKVTEVVKSIKAGTLYKIGTWAIFKIHSGSSPSSARGKLPLCCTGRDANGYHSR
jgi:hypothetical protein